MDNTEIKKAIEVLRKASENHLNSDIIESHLDIVEKELIPLSFKDWLNDFYSLQDSDSIKIESVIFYYEKYNNEYLKEF